MLFPVGNKLVKAIHGCDVHFLLGTDFPDLQAPVGFELDSAGRLTNIDPLATFRSPYWMPLAIHSSLSCYIAVGFAVAGVYAAGMLRGHRDASHRSGLTLAKALATVTALFQLVSGDYSGRVTARHQPAKLAAAEALFETQKGAPLVIVTPSSRPTSFSSGWAGSGSSG